MSAEFCFEVFQYHTEVFSEVRGIYEEDSRRATELARQVNPSVGRVDFIVYEFTYEGHFSEAEYLLIVTESGDRIAYVFHKDRHIQLWNADVEVDVECPNEEDLEELPFNPLNEVHYELLLNLKDTFRIPQKLKEWK